MIEYFHKSEELMENQQLLWYKACYIFHDPVFCCAANAQQDWVTDGPGARVDLSRRASAASAARAPRGACVAPAR